MSTVAHRHPVPDHQVDEPTRTADATYPPLARLLAPRAVDVGLLVRPSEVGGRVAYGDLVRRGALVEVWDGVAAPARVPHTPTLRALAVRDLVPTRTVLAGAGAAWVLCGGRRPDRLDVLYPPGSHRPAPLPGRVPRQATVLRSETELVAGVLVTAPRRTALDVATRCDRATALEILRLLRSTRALDVAGALRSLELRFRWPGRERAREVLDLLLAEDAPPG
ncbi:hypothetical protein V5D56_13530 [Cellulosimicrobium sp. PMB13]|uniref:hypothetical protein n=1 Tax=Cellulosimicrobium sp. PMB13 TaxID=3120158 RepID=UPI003F4C44B5